MIDEDLYELPNSDPRIKTLRYWLGIAYGNYYRLDGEKQTEIAIKLIGWWDGLGSLMLRAFDFKRDK